MIRIVVVIGLLVASAIGLLTTDANAAFIGFSVKGYSELIAEIDLNEVKNLKFDQQVTVTGSLNFIEVLCQNPENKAVTPGNAGSRVLETTTQPVTAADLTDRQGNKATLTIEFGEEELSAVEAEVTCNNLWTVVPGSAAAQSLSLTLSQERLSNQGLVIVDTVNIICTLDPILRDADGLPLHEQFFTCNVVN